ncbi:hypothetical protein HGRIS_008580 [Hohenbuehelia grisea]|uniref:Uncharacterized protein n=1 Tax=Hohenbuehelia grisea TaxID=104357 RepID=A0ABR3J9F9_9AGAR
MLRTALILASAYAISAASLPLEDCSSVPVHLAVQPKCGTLGGAPGDLNAGLRTLGRGSFKSIVAFGDAYTDGGAHGGAPLKPAVLTPPNPEAGGRASNGNVYVENLAKLTGATLYDFAENGAVTDTRLWPNAQLSGATDFVNQAHNYIGQRKGLDSDSTLYTIFFGMGDFDLSLQKSDTADKDLYTVAGDIIYTLLELVSYPTYAKNVLLIDNYGRGTSSEAGEKFKAGVFTGLNTMRTKYGINFGYVDLKTIWDGVLGDSPGFEAFGYTSIGPCLKDSSTTEGACSSPDTTFYWFPNTPSRATHCLIGQFITKALDQCQA